jgi:hypothetical protein
MHKPGLIDIHYFWKNFTMIISNSTILIIIFSQSFSFFYAQMSGTLTLKSTYKNNPLCNWEITLKQNDVLIGKSVSNHNGIATFENVTIDSSTLDASGYKAHKKGDKKWEAKGQIKINEEFKGKLELYPIIVETAQGNSFQISALENAWGLNIFDCVNDDEIEVSRSELFQTKIKIKTLNLKLELKKNSLKKNKTISIPTEIKYKT